MWWLNKDHRCRDRERKRAEANDIPRALQHMAHQSRVKPPHKLHALYIAICINKLLLSCSQTLMHEQEGSASLKNKLFYLFSFILAQYCDPLFPHETFPHSQANPLISTLSFKNIYLSFPEWWNISYRVTKVQVKQVIYNLGRWNFNTLSYFFLLSFPLMPKDWFARENFLEYCTLHFWHCQFTN